MILASDAEPGRSSALQHTVQVHGVEGWGWKLSGDGHVRVDGDMPVQVSLQGRQLAAWGPLAAAHGQLSLQAQGPLDELLAQGELRWGGVVERAAQGGMDGPSVVDVKAGVHPFQAWPLGTVSVALNKVKLHALVPVVPVATWTGQADLKADKQGAATLKLTARNEQAGAWDQSRLPVQSVTGELAWSKAPGQVDWLAWLHGVSGRFEANMPTWTPAGGRQDGQPCHGAKAV
jgi:hypothetical protein